MALSIHGGAGSSDHFFGSIASVGFRGINDGRQNVGSADTWSGGPKHSEDDRG